MDLVEKLQTIHPIISRLLELSDAPGLFLGILHHGKILHTAHFGRKQADYPDNPDDDTIC